MLLCRRSLAAFLAAAALVAMAPNAWAADPKTAQPGHEADVKPPHPDVGLASLLPPGTSRTATTSSRAALSNDAAALYGR